MAIIDLLTVCFILCLFSLGFKLIENIKEEDRDLELGDLRDTLQCYEEEINMLYDLIDELEFDLGMVNTLLEEAQKRT